MTATDIIEMHDESAANTLVGRFALSKIEFGLAVLGRWPDTVSLRFELRSDMIDPPDDYPADHLMISDHDFPKIEANWFTHKGARILDGYAFDYQHPSPDCEESPVLIYDGIHRGFDRMAFRLSYLGAGTYRCRMDAMTEWKERLTLDVTLPFDGLRVVDSRTSDPAYLRSIAERYLGPARFKTQIDANQIYIDALPEDLQ